MQLIFGSIVRHLLTLFAGGLISIGINESDTANLVTAVEPVLTGAALYGAAQVWSLVDKKKSR
jgi:hypothetical protein